jgi:hypothetical protein
MRSVTVDCGAVNIDGPGALGDIDAATWSEFISNLNDYFGAGYETGTLPVAGAACSGDGTYEQEVVTVSDLGCTDTYYGVEVEIIYRLRTAQCIGGFYSPLSTVDRVTRYRVESWLDSPVHYDQVIQDCKDLLDEWRLNDDNLYPWRVDGNSWLMPLVTRDANSTVPSISFAVRQPTPPAAPGDPELDCRFVDEINYTGALRGAPLPVGYAAFYNFYHTNWNRYTNEFGCFPCATSLGAESPLPHATQWTDYELGSSMMGPGAHISNCLDLNYSTGSPGKSPGDYIFMQKWCETQEQWPALNLARLCGHDRELLDADAMEAACPDETPIYLHTGVTPFCGQLTFTAAQTAVNEITITTSRKHWLRVGDTVTLTGITGAGTTVVTVPSATTFTVTGTLVGTSGTLGSVNEWDTTCSRRQFVCREWQSNYRTYTLTTGTDPEVLPYVLNQTQHEYTYEANKPFVLCCSPNQDDVFESGISFAWGTIGPDQCYGEEWHRDFVQAVQDPRWVAPPQPCEAATWVGATVPCGEGDYEYPPLVEPMLGPIDGAPEPPETFYSATDSAMPGAVGTVYCESQPRSRATLHNIRAAWLECNDWHDSANANCGIRGW